MDIHYTGALRLNHIAAEVFFSPCLNTCFQLAAYRMFVFTLSPHPVTCVTTVTTWEWGEHHVEMVWTWLKTPYPYSSYNGSGLHIKLPLLIHLYSFTERPCLFCPPLSAVCPSVSHLWKGQKKNTKKQKPSQKLECPHNADFLSWFNPKKVKKIIFQRFMIHNLVVYFLEWWRGSLKAHENPSFSESEN